MGKKVIQENKEKWALVTGGSSGIGMELAKLLANDGYSLVIVAKPQEELDRAKVWFDENMPETKIVYHQKDLAVQEAAQELYDFTSQNGYDIETLINNAGFGCFGWHYDLDLNRVSDMINLHVYTNWKLNRLYLKDMMAKDQGKILITSSGMGFTPGPKFAAYAASKAFSFYYAMGIEEELRLLKSKVSITVLCPSPTNTGFAKAAEMEDSKSFAPGSKLLFEPDFVAKKAYKGLKKRKRMVAPNGLLMGIMVKILFPLARVSRVVSMLKIAKFMSD